MRLGARKPQGAVRVTLCGRSTEPYEGPSNVKLTSRKPAAGIGSELEASSQASSWRGTYIPVGASPRKEDLLRKRTILLAQVQLL